MEQTKQLVIGGAKARELYPTADAIWKASFEETFGKDYFSLKPMDRIKTVEDACQVLGVDPGTILHKKLETVIKALNFLANGNKIWIPDYNNTNERKWYCWWWMNSPGFRLGAVACAFSDTGVGARLVFLNEELARYAADQFFSLFKEYYVMQPDILTEKAAVAKKKITDFREINSFEVACSVKGYDPAKVLPDASVYPEHHRAALMGVAKMFIITEAINYVDNSNQDWEPDFNDGDEEKHYPWADMEVDSNNPSGFRLNAVYCAYSFACVGARLVYKSEDGARHAFTQFESVYKDIFVLE
jgi:hypothetical protein